MKKLVALLAIPVFLLGACSKPSSEQRYVRDVHNAGVIGDDSSIISIGHNVCDALDAGVDLPTVIDDGLSAGLSQGEVGTIIGYAITDLCPHNQNKVSTDF